MDPTPALDPTPEMTRILALTLREIRHRLANSIASALAVAVSVALLVGFALLLEAQERETRRLMRDLGRNLRLIHAKTNLSKFYADGYSDLTFDEQRATELAAQGEVSYNHLSARLYRRIEWRGESVLLSGLSASLNPPGKRKTRMGFEIAKGSLQVGYAVGKRLDLKDGDRVTLQGREFLVARALQVESGTVDDVRVWLHLSDAQALLSLEGQISEIEALDCSSPACLAEGRDPFDALSEDLARVAPDLRALRLRSLADTRAKQRFVVEQQASFLLPFIVIGCSAWIFLLSAMNVRDRKSEIGILKALGRSTRFVLTLFLTRAFLIGFTGGIVGAVIGNSLVLYFGPQIFPTTAKAITWSPTLSAVCVAGAPIFAMLSGFVPALAAGVSQPTKCLRGST
ncbi:MAG: FtsX-like permease family protein [Planctomycetota bacterium]